MIRINLLPFRAARRKENVRRQISIFILSLFLIAVGLLWWKMHLNNKIEDLSEKVDNTRRALLAKKKQVAEADEIQKKLDVLKKKTEVITNLALNRKEAVVLMDTMPKMIIEKKMWFTSLEETKMSLTIKGVALDNKTVADFMTRLETSELFSNVRLQSTKKTKIGDYENLKSFVVTLNKIPLSEIVNKKDAAKKS
jgi:type IV pilus assembly protein PilN